MRARIDVSEIEAKTKIRAKYLRALENEEWGLLPGPTFVKSFLRTYAQALGLDGKALVEEYRLRLRGSERVGARADRLHAAAQPRAADRRRRALGRRWALAVGRALARLHGDRRRRARLIVLLIVCLVTNGGGSSSNPTSTQNAAVRLRHLRRRSRRSTRRGHRARPRRTHAEHDRRALAEADARGLRVPDRRQRAQADLQAVELQRGRSTPTFHARHFTITLGNSSVTMFVDGHARSRAAVQPGDRLLRSARPRGRQTLRRAAQLPTCAVSAR